MFFKSIGCGCECKGQAMFPNCAKELQFLTPNHLAMNISRLPKKQCRPCRYRKACVYFFRIIKTVSSYLDYLKLLL